MTGWQCGSWIGTFLDGLLTAGMRQTDLMADCPSEYCGAGP